MSLYRYYFFDSNDRLKCGGKANCSSHEAAITTGLTLLLDKPDAFAVEIWQDENFIGGERRDLAPYVTSRTSDSSLRTHPMFSLDQKNWKTA